MSQVMAEIHRAFWSPSASIEVDVQPATLDALLDRLREQWRKLGENEPHWSVLTARDYLAENLDAEKLAEFYDSGREAAKTIELFEEKTGFVVKNGLCFELGCGVGRVTAHLARRFDRVIAADISPGNLRICAQRMQHLGLTNVKTELLRSPDEIDALPRFDFFYSVIVLQHNPPPIQKAMLNSILGRIAPGGACQFQTPDALPNYGFSAEAYLKDRPRVMDMHCLPKTIVLKLLSQHGMQVRDIQLDMWIGCFGSYTYFASKPEGSPDNAGEVCGEA
jgi:SAM-dependent methyltransferase